MKANTIAAEHTPKQIGDFEILHELGRGGMGVVYEANQKSLNRRVALKVLSTGLGLTTKAVMRFKREAEAAAKLHHTNIVPIYSTGDEGRVPYYAMELVDGPSLDQVIRQLRDGSDNASKGSLESTDDAFPDQKNSVPDWVEATIGVETPNSGINARASTALNSSGSSSSFVAGSTYFDNVAKMMSEIADALAHAHDQGVIHRDIKPSNLLLSRDGRLSVNDFGLARMLEQPGMTISGELMGSPMYMSPEQIAVGRIPLDHRTDIYSLGASLYQMLTLQTPFDGQQRDQVLSQIIHKEPARPRVVDSKIPKDLETICLKAMEKDPDRRYQTAKQMAEDLQRFVDRHTISARRVGIAERAVRWAKRHRALTASLACTLLLGVIALGVGVAAYQERKELLREQAMDNAIAAALGGDSVRAKKEIVKAELHGASVAWVEMLQGQVAIVEGRSSDAIEHLQLATELEPENIVARAMFAEAFLYDSQWSTYQQHLNRLADVHPETYLEKSFVGKAQIWVNPAEAARLLDEAVNERRSAIGLAFRSQARTYLAVDSGQIELLEAASQDAEGAVALLPDNDTANNNQLFNRCVAAVMYRDRGDKRRAEDLLRDAEANASVLARSANYEAGRFWRANYYRLRGDFSRSTEVYDSKDDSQLDPGFGAQLIAANAYTTGRFAEAVDILDRVPQPRKLLAEVSRQLLLLELQDGANLAETAWLELKQHPTWDPHETRAFAVLWLLGKREQARKETTEALDLIEPSQFTGFIRKQLSFQAGQLSEDELIQSAGSSRTKLAEAHHIIGLVKLSKGDREAARRHFEKSVETNVFWWGDVVWSRAWLSRFDYPDWLPWLPKHYDAED